MRYALRRIMWCEVVFAFNESIEQESDSFARKLRHVVGNLFNAIAHGALPVWPSVHLQRRSLAIAYKNLLFNLISGRVRLRRRGVAEDRDMQNLMRQDITRFIFI